MDEQRQDDQLESIYNNSVPIPDIAVKTSWEQWTIETGGEKGSGRFLLDNDDIYIGVFTMFIFVWHRATACKRVLNNKTPF